MEVVGNGTYGQVYKVSQYLLIISISTILLILSQYCLIFFFQFAPSFSTSAILLVFTDWFSELMLLYLVFGRNITLRYDTGIIRVFYAHVIFNFTPPFLRPNFTAPEIRSKSRSMNYPEMPCEWSIAGEYRGCSSL